VTLSDAPDAPSSTRIIGERIRDAVMNFRPSRSGIALTFLAAVVLFIPVRRYAIPIPLPFALEPYRLAIALLVLAVGVALLIDPKFTWRPIAFGVPLIIWLITMIVSVATNATSITEEGLASGAIGALGNYALVVSLLYLTRQLLRSTRTVNTLLTALTVFSGVVGFFALVEKVTRQNIFMKLSTFLPLEMLRDEGEAFRAGGARAYASAQHPIALSVMLCMLIPIAIYLARYAAWPLNIYNRKIFFGGIVALQLLGVAAAVSRTAVVTLAVMFLLILILRPILGIVLASFAIPAVLAAAAVIPKPFEAMFGGFLDPDALIASQKTSPGFTGAGRLADLDPALEIVAQQPFFGSGLGSRIVIGDTANSFILDNQWLGTLMEVGALGVLGVLALLLMPTTRLFRYAFSPAHTPQYTALALALAISIMGYTTAMFFYDAFGFFQTFMLLFILLGVGAWVLTEAPTRNTVVGPASGQVLTRPLTADGLRPRRRRVRATS
jgi:O-antigen ligase